MAIAWRVSRQTIWHKGCHKKGRSSKKASEAICAIGKLSTNPFLSQEIADLREFVDSRIAERNLKDIILLDSMLYERRAYKKAVEDGLSLDEFGDSKAMAEFTLFFNEIVKYGNENIK